MEIADLVEPELYRIDQKGSPLSVPQEVCIFLVYFGQATFQVLIFVTQFWPKNYKCY
jgi:hypothetical protein